MYHYIEAIWAESLLQLLLIVQVELYEMYAFVGEKLLAAAAAHGSPDLVTPVQGLGHNETANKTAGTSNEYLLHTL